MQFERPSHRLKATAWLVTLSALFATFFLAFAAPLAADRPDPSAASNTASRQAAWQRHQELDRTSPFRGLEWRDVGPVVQGGRIVDIESVPGEPYSFYVAYASGGVWKTTNNGVTFEPLSDDQPTMIVGDIAVDPQNPKTIWVGTGENNSSRSSYGGLGVYRTDDGGETWAFKGLEDSDRIGRMLVDPRDSKRVYVAVIGKLYTTGGQRGVYRTTDGGDTWSQVLAPEGGEMTGFIDLVQDPSNPDVLYAAAWERSRKPWDFVESGPGSGIYKTTDGGDTWKRLGGGLPQGEHVGRIGLALAASQPRTIYAALDNQEELPEEQWDLGAAPVTPKRLRKMSKEDFLAQDPEAIEDFIRGNDLDVTLDAKKLIKMVKNDEITLEQILEEISDANANLFNTDIRGLEMWRSDNGGETWTRTHEEPIRDVVYTYGYYFAQVRVSPTDPERIYTVGVPIITSGDGGKTFESIQDRSVHVDYHAMWIDPNFTDRVMVGNDGGLDMSYDGGQSWIKLDAQSVGQFYAIELDNAKPYNIYGGLQDNGVLKGSSQSISGVNEWRVVGGGDGMYVEVDPRDNTTTYWGFQFGFYFRNDGDGGGGGRRGGGGSVRPRDALGDPAMRYNWMTPILLSDHNSDILYFGANRLYRSMDQGTTWTAISDDLTRSKNRGDVPFATITTIAESPEQFGLLWVGTDDGLVWMSDNGGVDWFEVSKNGLPRDRWVTRVEASRVESQRAYVSLSGYRDDDITAYLYVTEDQGLTWKSLAEGLPAEAVNVVREDPVNADVLYVGTERGVYVSLSRGLTWEALGAGMPNVPVHDLKVHHRDRELVAGTHGRSIWVIDALPIQELGNVEEDAIHVFPLEDVQHQRFWQGRRSPWFSDPTFDPKVKIPFWSAEAGTAKLTVMDEDERPLRHVEMEIEAGVSVLTWNLLMDEDLALAAEKARLEAAAEEKKDSGEKKGKKGKKRKQAEAEQEADKTGRKEGELARKPWSEAKRLGWQMYVTPGTYVLRIDVGEASGETQLKIKKGRSRPSRIQEEEKIRGEKDDDAKKRPG